MATTRILLTTASFQETPGKHHSMLEELGYEIVRDKGPLDEAKMLEYAGEFDAFLCGDDDLTAAVLEKATPRLKVISKYGIGIDRIDIEAAKRLGLRVTNCPGVNHTTVAEHVIGLTLAAMRTTVAQHTTVASGQWKRQTGFELMGKTYGIVGLGRIGKEVALRAKAFGVKLIGFDVYWPEEFAAENGIERKATIQDLLKEADIISLNCNLTDQTRNLIGGDNLSLLKKEAIIVNCARGGLVDTHAVCAALDNGALGHYATDVLDTEPPAADHPMLKQAGVTITPHIASRTYENVVRQAVMAVENLKLAMSGQEPLAVVV